MYIWNLVSQVTYAAHPRDEFDPWVGKIPWRRDLQPNPVFWPGKSHGQRSMAGHSPWGLQRIGHN